MNRTDQDPGSISDTAARWLARHDRGLSGDELREFADWQDADWRHAEEFARLRSEWESFGIAGADPELVAMARELDARTRRVRPFPRSLARWAVGVAAAAAVVLCAVALRRDPASHAPGTPVATYEVMPSAARTMTLADGSVVDLRGDSEISVDMTGSERRIRLLRGEAHFTVAKDPRRPFTVSAGAVSVRAVGTAFNVRLGVEAVEVLVTEGKVRVDDLTRGKSLVAPATAGAAPILQAGQKVVIAANTAVGKVQPAQPLDLRPAEVDQMLSWQSTRLIFNRTTLADAVEAFNQQGRQRIAIGDDTLRGQLLGGTFRADNVDGFVRLLEQAGSVHAQHLSDGTTVLWPAR